MKTIEGDYKTTNGKDYFYAVANKSTKKIQIFKNFGCLAAICQYLEDERDIPRFLVSNVFSVTFLGDSIDLLKVPKKYSKFELI